MSTPLSEQEQARLSELETAIERSYIEIGNALGEIRDSRLYRATHRNFDDYCRERWHFSRQRAGQLINAAKAATTVVNLGLPAPENERQARLLEAELRQLQARYGDDVTPERVMQVASDFFATRARGLAYYSSISQVWHTDGEYIEAARRVLGGIDLDPASDAKANKTVRAKSFLTKEDGGLKRRPWYGRVWMNPPFGRDGQAGRWANALIEEYESGHVSAAIMLLNGRNFDHVWFRDLWDFPICFTDHRARLRNPRRRPSERPSMGAVFVYLGPHPVRFAEEFSRFGPAMNEKPASRERRRKRARRAA
jgi:DNA N-6-adenine-methyltransferase (Dam)